MSEPDPVDIQRPSGGAVGSRRRAASRHHRRATWRIVRHSMRVSPVAFWGGGVLWWLFVLLQLGAGLLLERLFDAIQSASPAVWLLAGIAGLEVTRGLLLPLVGWVFEPYWGTTETVLRTNVLRAQLHEDPDERGTPLPDASGALPLFREDPESIARAGDVWMNLVVSFVVAIVAILVLARIGLGVALAVGLPLVVAAAVGYLLTPLVRARRAADRAVTSEVTGFLGEVFGAVTTLTTAGATPAVLDRLRVLCARRRVTAVRDRVAEQLLPAVGAGTADLALAAGLFVSALTVADGLTPGQVALLASYAMLLAGFPRHWAGWLATRRHAEVGVERMRSAVRDGTSERLIAPVAPISLDPDPVPLRVAEPMPPAPRLTLVRLRAAAPDGGIVGPVDAEVPAGGLLVVSGPVGAGKSTLLRAIVGLAPIVSGELRWDGEPVDAERQLRPPRATYVPQVPVLFSEDVAANLRLGRDVSDAELEQALHAAASETLSGDLERGLETPLGPRGVRLSGGQAHRVAAARAVAAGGALLVADDLSAALDAPTEARLLDRLLEDRQRTVVAVSHRPAVLARADVVVDLGRQR